jgi:hypothetical protein
MNATHAISVLLEAVDTVHNAVEEIQATSTCVIATVLRSTPPAAVVAKTIESTIGVTVSTWKCGKPACAKIKIF